MTHAQPDRRAVIAAGLALPISALAQPLPDALPNLESGPFRFKGWRGQETDAERGGLSVPEDRRDPGSRRIRLGYVRFPATTDRPGPPIVYLAGGPGVAATAAAAGPRFPIFLALRAIADVIAIDQRGTGLSNAIPPRPGTAGPLPAFTRDALTLHVREDLRRAWADWTASGVAMAGYNTAQSADDIDDLRRHLGAERIDLWGISYGSHLALSVLKRHGDRVGRVALASLEGQDQTVKRPARIDAYLRRAAPLLAPGGDGSGLLDRMRRVHARLEAEPVALTVPLGGAPTTLRLGGFAVQLLAGALIADPQGLAMLPALYAALDAGRTATLAPFLGDIAGVLKITGMPEAMDLASGISPRRRVQVEREAPTAILGDSLNFPMPHLSGVLPDVDLGEAFRAPIRIDHPALLVAGTLDGRTPLEEQAEVAAQFRRKIQVTVENAGHNVFEAHPEVQSLLVRFFRGEAIADTRLHLPPPQIRTG
jgi:pimeloyl-ACP methyl ester carboxylesterase